MNTADDFMNLYQAAQTAAKEQTPDHYDALFQYDDPEGDSAVTTHNNWTDGNDHDFDMTQQVPDIASSTLLGFRSDETSAAAFLLSKPEDNAVLHQASSTYMPQDLDVTIVPVIKTTSGTWKIYYPNTSAYFTLPEHADQVESALEDFMSGTFQDEERNWVVTKHEHGHHTANLSINGTPLSEDASVTSTVPYQASSTFSFTSSIPDIAYHLSFYAKGYTDSRSSYKSDLQPTNVVSSHIDAPADWRGIPVTVEFQLMSQADEHTILEEHTWQVIMQ